MISVFAHQFLSALLWMLLHSLWLGFVLTILTALVIVMTRSSAPALRYRLLLFLFLGFLISAGMSFMLALQSDTADTGDLLTSYNASATESTPLLTKVVHQVIAYLEDHAATVVFFWMLVMVTKALLLALSLQRINRLRSQGTDELSAEWKKRVLQLANDIGLTKSISLLQTVRVSVPVVIGHFKPLILVPVGFLNHLTTAEAEAVLLHELAHIKRHDYAVNVLQHVAELLFFFNPGLLWVSSQLRREREHCCDELALQHASGKRNYIDMLIRCREQLLRKPVTALGFSGQKSDLVLRVTRLVLLKNSTLTRWEAAFLLLNVMALSLWMAGRRPEVVVKLETGMGLIYKSAMQPVDSLPVVTDKRLQVPTRSVTLTPVSGQSRVVKKRGFVPAVAKAVKPDQENREPYLSESKLIQPISAIVTTTLPDVESQAEKDRIQAQKDRFQAEKDRAQAERDRIQAEIDRQQAIKDREAAARDRIQAQKDRLQADQDRLQMQKERQATTTRSIVQ
ncbi:MAG TPA: M56 family metallopeptidase [Flavisolibacter sp.]|jgi:beta-lactamase regulating signal transducer with metallopeptidase domain|nr:M56 family metallopeptidase [Flavisolibacter sp.]